LAKACPTPHVPAAGVSQELRCAEGLESCGVAVHVLSCVETMTGADGVATTTTFMWVSDMAPAREGLAKMANKAGRQRWKIENHGFNTRKNHGYSIKHGFGVTGHAWATTCSRRWPTSSASWPSRLTRCTSCPAGGRTRNLAGHHHCWRFSVR